jgi:hypothetical protein
MAQTPSTEDLYEGDGSQTVFALTFPYLSKAEVFVSVNGVNTPYSWLAGSTASVQLSSAPAVGAIIRVYRSTLAYQPLHVFAGGVPFLPRYIDENNRQLLYSVQEAVNETAGTASNALIIAEEAKEIAERAEEKVDGAIIDSAYQLRTDLLNPAIGARIVAHNARTVQASLDDYINVLDVGPVDTPANTELTFMLAFVKATTAGKPLHVPGGTYSFNTIPNLAASNFHMYVDGNVRFKCLGSAGTWAWDLTAGASNLYNFRIVGNLQIEGNSSNTGGVHIQALHHSVIELRALNVPGVAFQINYGVLTAYKLTASINVGPGSEWAIVPTTGLAIDGRNTGEFTSACWFDLRMEGIAGVGVQVNSCQQATFTGTSEHNTGHGIVTAVGSKYNTFTCFDIEQNTGNDLRAGGISDVWNNITCRSNSNTNNIEIMATAENNTFNGGDLRSVNMNSGSRGTFFNGCRFSSNAALGMKGPGVYTHHNCSRYDVSGVFTSLYTTRLGQRGTFTPVISGSTTAGTQTYSVQVGNYEVINGRLFWDVNITLTAKDAATAGTLIISGFPIPSRNVANLFTAGPVARHANVVRPTAGYENVIWRCSPGSPSVTLLATGYGLAEVSVAAGSLTATSSFCMSGSWPIEEQI